MMENLTIIIPFYRGHQVLPRLIDSLPAGIPVLVVDDGYSEGDSFPDLGEAENGRVSVLHLNRKGYFAGAVNAGIQACRTDVLVLNQDTWLEGDRWLQLLADKRGEYALIGERIRGEHPAFPQGYVHGTFMFMRRDAIDAVGLLNEQDYPLWGNTAEWQWRAARKGFQALPLETVSGFHHERKPRERFGSSIRQLLSQRTEQAGKLVRTPPLVSVIVPCYNYGRYLPDCIASLLGGPSSLGPQPGQTLQSFEVIIVDDASKDDSAEIAQSLADDWRGVRFIPRERNGGTARALNTGIQAASGQYITFLSADDMRTPDALEKLVRTCEANPHSFAYDDVQMFGGGKLLRTWAMQEYDFERLLVQNQIHAGIMYPKKAWEEVGGYPPMFGQGREDWAFNVALGEKGWCGVHVEHFGYLYRREGQNRSLRNTTPQHRAEFLDQMRRTFPHLYRGERPMACCGGRRSSATSAQNVQAASAKSTRMAGAEGFVEIEYVGSQQLLTFTGSVTNTRYRFGVTRRHGFVDKRDVGERPTEGRGGSGFLALRRNGQFLFRVAEPKPVAAVKPVAEVNAAEPVVETEVVETVETVAVPDPNTLTVDEIRDLDLSPVAWAQLLDAERAGKNRKSAVEFIEAQLEKVG